MCSLTHLTQYEYSKIISDRAQEIADGVKFDGAFSVFKTSCKGVEVLDPIATAMNELHARCSRVMVERRLPTGEVIVVDPNKMFFPW
jgi:hypothetical protein